MNINALEAHQIIGDCPRFASPFREPCGYYIFSAGNDRSFGEGLTQEYLRRLTYFKENADSLIRQAFSPEFFNFYGVDRALISSPEEMCRQLTVDSFALNADDNTVACCLTSSRFMAGHYIECVWNDVWELTDSGIC